MKTLNVMSLDFVYKAAIRGFESVSIQRVWNGIDTLSMTINSQITNAGLIGIDDLLWFDNEYRKAFIVERVDESLSGSTVQYEISAKGLGSLLRDFITVPPPGYDYDSRTGTREAIVRAWVNENCISPSDTTRIQYPIALGTLNGLGDTITDQTRYTNLADEIARVLAPQDLSYNIKLDIPNNQFVFNVLEGVNRTSIQSINSRILFGLKYGNVSEYKKVLDSSGERNVIYVGGSGEGAAQLIVKVDGSASRKKEVFANAGSITTESELEERGSQSLSEQAIVNTYEFVTLDRQFTYEVNYDLGDYVTVVIDSDNVQHLQINKIKEVYQKGKIQIIPEFGKTERTITGAVSSIASRVSSLETAKAGISIDDTQTNTTSVWSSSKTNTAITAHATSESWITPTFQNSWANYDATYNTCQYYKDKHGFVHLKGLVRSGSANTTIFTLPAGYRPLLRYLFPTISNSAIGRIDVAPDGQVIMQAGSNAWLSLDGINFKAEQ